MNDPWKDKRDTELFLISERIPEAFRALWERIKAILFAKAAWILHRDPSSIPDAVQETLKTIVEHRKDLVRGTGFRTWMMKIHVNHCFHILRDRHPEKRLPRTDPAAPAPGLDEQADRSALLDRLNAALEGLPDEERELVERHFGEGTSYPKIAADLGVHHSTIYERSDKAYQRLREALGIDPDDDL